jgi:SAM-dependent methyltransferase
MNDHDVLNGSMNDDQSAAPTAVAPREGDAFGAALLAHHRDGEQAGRHVLERDDGRIEAMSAAGYFADPDAWLPAERRVLDLARGRVLDIGAGAGRFALELIERGHEVTALDVSNGALEVCRERGVSDVYHGTVFDLAAAGPERYDTFLLMGGNLGLLESAEHGPRFLQALEAMAVPGAVVLGIGMDPFDTDDPDHLAYHEFNRSRGRAAGAVLLRVRYRRLATPWFEHLLQPTADLAAMAEAGGWRLGDVADEPPWYLATLRQE